MLTAYLTTTRQLLNDENKSFFSDVDLTAFVNNGRNDVARQTECVIGSANLALINGTQSYAISGLTKPSAGYGVPVSARSVRGGSGGFQAALDRRVWQWFTNYYLGYPNGSATGIPQKWSQQIQGADALLYFWPTPNATLTAIVEAVWTPTPLVDDTTAEIIPQPWTDAIPFFAAYEASVQVQKQARAQELLGYYKNFLIEARMGVTPDWLATAYPMLKTPPQGADTTGRATAQPAPGEGALP